MGALRREQQVSLALVLRHQVGVLAAHVVEHLLIWQFARGAEIGWSAVDWLRCVGGLEELLALVANDWVDLPHAEGEGALVRDGSLAVQLLLRGEVLTSLELESLHWDVLCRR